MLWFKAWLETRTRFLASLVGLTLLCGFAVFVDASDASMAAGASRLRFLNGALFAAHMAHCVLWVCAISFLMMGGLLREADAEVSSFTLALPVSRARLMLVRIGMGLAQAVALGVIPCAAMWFATKAAGGSPSILSSVYYLIFLIGGGTLFFAIALLLSATIRGAYTAPLLSLLTFAGIFEAMNGATLRAWNPWFLMAGVHLMNPRTASPSGPLPWVHFALSNLVSAVLVWLSVVAIQRQDL